jgi:5'-nucleotidase
VIAASMKLNGTPIDPAASYRVTVNNYLALGGDGFTALKQGLKPQFGVYDDEALFAYFQANGPIAPPPADRITQSN